MRHRKRKLKIEAWDESGPFRPALREKQSEVTPSFDGRKVGATLDLLKPIGFYVAYSYTLFRKGQRPDDPLYAFY
jgi:hypothetical protein